MLSAVALVGLLVNSYYFLVPRIETDGTNRLMNLIFCSIGLALSLPSIIKQNNFTRGIQIASILLAGVFCFSGGPGGAPFGAIIIFFGIKASESYGFFEVDPVPKIITVAFVVYLLILASIPGAIDDKWPSALAYTIFDAVLIFFLKVLDSEKEEKTKLRENRMLDTLEETEILLQEAIELARKGDKNGCD